MVNVAGRNRLLERDESRRVRGSDTWSSVLDWLVRDGELGEVVSDHLGSDLNLVENLSIVNSDDGSDHLWDDDHVSQVRLDRGRLLVGRGILLRLTQFLDKSHGLSLETSLELSSSTSVDNVHQLLRREVE